MKNILFHMSVIFLLFVMVVMNTGETASARSVYKHKIFSKSVVSKRIDTIKQFYYKKSKQLKTKNQTVTLNFEKGKMTYYFHGNDLMFSYGKIKGKEYRAYYLKKQLIQLLVDKSEKRKTYIQYYKKSANKMMEEYNTASLYFTVENYARKMLESIQPSTTKKSFDDYAIVTKIKGNTVWYHKVDNWGSDGSIYSIEPKTFKAVLKDKCTIKDASESPEKAYKRSKKWIKKRVDKSIVGQFADLTVNKGKIKEIMIPYMP